MRPLVDAQRAVLDALPRLDVVPVPLQEALGLVAAEPIAAAHDVPPFTNSAMDGYAVRAADVATVPVRLRVVEDVAAGSVAGGVVEAGTAMKIMTGAPLPSGADAVVKVEDTEPDDGGVRILASVHEGTAVRMAGGDVAAGTIVVSPGTRLGPAHLGMLASFGVAAPMVRRRPLVAIMSTGAEVMPVDMPLRPGAIHDSNRPLLRSLLTELGADILDLGIVGDDADELREAFTKAASNADVVVSSGGVSMGEYDYVKHVLGELGTVEFWKVAMQPAKPFAFGSIDETPLFGLPGNPVSVVVAFEQFLRPGLLAMMGARELFRPRVTARATEDIESDPAKTVFLRGAARLVGDHWDVAGSGGQSSNVLSALAAANCFVVVPEGVAHIASGQDVEIEMFQWPASVTRVERLGT